MKNLFLNTNTTIAIIGFGRFGSLLVSVLLKESKSKLIVISSKKVALVHKNLVVGSMNRVQDADVIIPCVPISSFETVIKQMAKFVKKEAIVIDVCSVKTLPVDIMKTNLPITTQIVASHPMFGPDSYRIKKTLHGLRLVICNISAKNNTYQQLRSFFQSLGLVTIELSPKNHDKLMAFSLGYSYFVGKIGQRMGIRKTPIDTHDFHLLLENISIVKSDSEQLFFDMQTKNPFAKDMLTKVNKTVSNLLDEVEQRR
ncbi:MAG TPA: prephenate dehydrogenase/arogenate dehydrogenase family protein [Patescibacteria group bacterium]|nr:prephenate dehydrogenase/arogenate dehydrogenase family protein [Patescibacteria group bacterium]